MAQAICNHARIRDNITLADAQRDWSPRYNPAPAVQEKQSNANSDCKSPYLGVVVLPATGLTSGELCGTTTPQWGDLF
jgi:hypothetical protein